MTLSGLVPVVEPQLIVKVALLPATTGLGDCAPIVTEVMLVGEPILRGQTGGLPGRRHLEHDAAVGVANLEIIVVGECAVGIGSVGLNSSFSSLDCRIFDEHRARWAPIPFRR